MSAFTPGIAFLAVFLCSCSPCRLLTLESIPPGADLFVPVVSLRPVSSPEEEWRFIGRTPLEVSACLVRDGIVARWEAEEIYLPHPVRSSRVVFDFPEGRVR